MTCRREVDRSVGGEGEAELAGSSVYAAGLSWRWRRVRRPPADREERESNDDGESTEWKKSKRKSCSDEKAFMYEPISYENWKDATESAI